MHHIGSIQDYEHWKQNCTEYLASLTFTQLLVKYEPSFVVF